MNEELKTTLKPAFDLLTENAIKYYKKHQYYGIHPDTVSTFVNCTGFLGRYLEFTLKALEGKISYDIDEASTKLDPYPKSREQI